MKQISTLISIILIALCPLTMAAQETNAQEQVQETAQTQQRAITGTLIDKETKEAIMQVTD